MATAAVVPAAGRGTRFGSAENKIWQQAAGRTLLDWTLSAFDSHPGVDFIVLAGSANELGRLRAAASSYKKVAAVVAGGESRQESVGNALAALPASVEYVLVHDAARPAISAGLIDRVLTATFEHGAAIPGLPVTDTLKRVGGDGSIEETVQRIGLWAVQTPQGARVEWLQQAYSNLGPDVAYLTDEASVLEHAGFPVHVVFGDDQNLKVTRPTDLASVAQILSERSQRPAPNALRRYRTGMGYDVHALVEGRELWLGGVRIPHDLGLAGHSDADVLLHAVCDALLGAAGLGDIGVLFPDTDAAHKDRASIEFLAAARRLLQDRGWSVDNVDVSLLAEAPRIGPYRRQMAEAIAEALGMAPEDVNLKATTAEQMGFVGRREGIACWAVATISKEL